MRIEHELSAAKRWLSNTPLGVKVIKETEADARALAAVLEDARLVGEIRELLRLCLTCMENAEANKHSPWCNGVHADNGACEGDFLVSRLMEQVRGQLKGGA